MAKTKQKRREIDEMPLDVVEREIERATKTYSKQPRFQGDTQNIGASILRMVKLAEIEVPEYTVNSPARDAILRQVAVREPHMAGVLNSVILVDANRGWNLVGGRNQVRRFMDVLHYANDGDGWRGYARQASRSFWATDMGSVTEIGRDGINGPMRAIYHVDPARCQLTGKIATPLQYRPQLGKLQDWPPSASFRVCSMPSDDESMRGLGFCAVSRALEVLRVLYAVMMHDQEMLAARAPRGLMLLHNITETQWNDAMQSRDMALDGLERKYYGAVAVIAQSGVDEMDAKLVALSQLPANFDMEQFVNLSMYAYALCFGYDASEFWPVQFGSLGRGNETAIQHAKATGKGGLDFVQSWQERFQRELPETLEFAFEERDDQGEVTAAAVKQAKVNVITSLYESGLMQGAPLLEREQALSLLVEEGIIPAEWTAHEEDVSVTDEEAKPDASGEGAAPGEERWLDAERVQRALERFPDEEIVRYHYPSRKMRTIWRPRQSPRYHVKARQLGGDVLYQKGDVVITQGDVDNAIEDGRRRLGEEFANLLTARPMTPEELATFHEGA